MNKSSGRTRGRPAGSSDARDRILAAARERFLAEGYQGVTMRSIAAAAGVDVALVSYYFSSKQGVFGAAMALPVNPLDAIEGVLALPDDQLAPAFLRTFLTVWDAPESGLPLRSMSAAAVGEPAMARVARELIGSAFIPRIAERLGGADGQQRAAAFATVMSGLILSRYLLQVQPIASMAIDEVVATLTPVVRAALWPEQSPKHS